MVRRKGAITHARTKLRRADLAHARQVQRVTKLQQLLDAAEDKADQLHQRASQAYGELRALQMATHT